MNKPGLRSSLSGPGAERIDRICDDFEQAWRARRQPKIEDMPPQIEQSLRDELLCELIAAEVDLRRECGQQVSQQEYLDRFPYQQDLVRKAFQLAPRHCFSEGQVSTAPNDTESALTETQPAVPTHIDRYKIERLLGCGSFGIVYLAH